MLRHVLPYLLILPIAAPAQGTIPVEEVPFKQSGSLAGRLKAGTEAVESFTPVPPEELSVELVTAARVLDSAGNRISDVDGLVIQDGMAEALIFTVGGVLGTFDHPVAVPLDRAQIGRSDDFGTRVVLDMTRQDLLALPPYDGQRAAN